MSWSEEMKALRTGSDPLSSVGVPFAAELLPRKDWVPSRKGFVAAAAFGASAAPFVLEKLVHHSDAPSGRRFHPVGMLRSAHADFQLDNLHSAFVVAAAVVWLLSPHALQRMQANHTADRLL